MRLWVYDCWNSVMNYERNPLRHIPDLHARHMIMQILAWIWCTAFSLWIGSFFVFGISAVAHVALLGAIVITVGTFETAKRKPSLLSDAFQFKKGYHTPSRGRQFTIYRDEKGTAHKVPLDKGDPGGEHE